MITISPAPDLQNPFQNDVAAFKLADKMNPPEKGQVLFIGSSSFTNWKDVSKYFPKRQILNRAFGGSTLADLVKFEPDIVTPYAPSKIVIYCGENDFAADSNLTSKDVTGRFQTLFEMIRSTYPKVPVIYISMKPSPSRTHLFPLFKSANKVIQEYLDRQTRTYYIDVWPVMFGKNHQLRRDIFNTDELHMNAKGYRLWTPLIEHALEVVK